jgi:hypothetical protein
MGKSHNLSRTIVAAQGHNLAENDYGATPRDVLRWRGWMKAPSKYLRAHALRNRQFIATAIIATRKSL